MGSLTKKIKKYGGYAIGPAIGATQQKIYKSGNRPPTDYSRAGFSNWQEMPAKTALGG